MATISRRRRDLIVPRRRVAEEGEEGGEETYNGQDLDDSLSDDSGLSEDEEEDEDEDEEDDDFTEDEQPPQRMDTGPTVMEETTKGVGQISLATPPMREATSPPTNGVVSQTALMTASKPNGPASLGETKLGLLGHCGTDTDFMVNGLNIESDMAEEEVDFEDIDDEGVIPEKRLEPKPDVVDNQPLTKQDDTRRETLHERRRREHEEYKKRRDADPAFVPNRGAFFMHDHRHQGGGSNGFRPFGRARAGRGGFFGRSMGFGR